MRTFADWESPLPGDMEADLVSHGGESAAGSFVHTLTLTDVASGWTECVALSFRDGALVVAALEQMRTRMPFPLRGLDTDNGGEFMNETVAAYCPFETVWPRVRTWPEAEPDRIGRGLLERLQGEQAGVFHDGQLRTFQRRVREWRKAAARRLVFASSQSAA